MNIVICGGGIIGSSCAYYLATRNIACTIIEQDEIASAASGKAGGFLARNWCRSNVSNDLAKLSYNLHMELTKIFNDVDYRCVDTYSVDIDNSENVSKKKIPNPIPWANGSITKLSLLDRNKNTAQVHPKKLCQRFLHEAQKLTNNQTKVIYDKVVGLEMDSDNSVPSVKAVKLGSGSILEANVVLIAMGPWSGTAVSWFPAGSIPKIVGQRAHSVVLNVPASVKMTADCLFAQYRDDTGLISPEIYPRPDGTVYVCGLNDDKELPDKASNVEVESWRCKKLRNVACATCSELESAETVAEQACYLPLSPDDVPLIGKIINVKGTYIAAGHSCWGILNSTGTGYAMAELISTGSCQSIDLAPFDPNRFQ